MARACIRAEISALGDRSVSVRSALGPAGRRLSNAIAGVSITEDRVALLAGQLSVPTKMTTVQQAIHELARQPGRLSLADVADAARIGERQLRRNCLAESGLSPKQLARILRFRHAADILSRENQDLTTIALDCGYYDQAHLNRDFRQLAGTTPAKYSRLRRS
jgi:transcriptional regulator GlxA family with amidase domain